MIINNSYKFVFVHVPKTGGTSISSALSPLTNYCDLEIGGTAFGEAIQRPYRNRFGLSKHATARKIKSVMGEVRWNRYFSFAFVRNPYKRAVSTYNFLRKWEGYDSNLLSQMRRFESFDEFVLSDLFDIDGPDGILRPQMYWLRESMDQENMAVDYVGRLETIEESLQALTRTIDLPKKASQMVELENKNRTGSSDGSEYNDPRVVERVYLRYKVDFRVFDYPKTI